MTEHTAPTTMWIASYDADFADLALGEISNVTGAAFEPRELAPGVMLIDGGAVFAEVAHLWREQPPVFVQHICPVDAVVCLFDEADDLAQIEAAAINTSAPRIDATRSFSVQTRVLDDVGFKPYDVNTRLAEALSATTGAHVDVRHPEQILSVVCVAVAPTRTVYVGLSDVEDNLSDWAGGMRRFARESDQVSRSEFKLLEALEVFQIELPPRGVALDLGAAPGGWTRILRQRAQYVTAIDPGELHPSLRGDSGVRHLKTTAEHYLEQEPDRFDVIVNDMRMDARDSARLMVRYARHLYRNGVAIMTLKLPERGRRTVLDHSLRILEDAYDILGVRHLFHNRSEVTVYLARRNDVEPDAASQPDA